MNLKLIQAIGISLLFCASVSAGEMRYENATDSTERCDTGVEALVDHAYKVALQVKGKTPENLAKKIVLASCDLSGRFNPIRISQSNERLSIYVSAFFKNGVVISFVDERGNFFESVPYMAASLDKLGLSVAQIRSKIAALPTGSQKGYLAFDDAYERSLSGKSLGIYADVKDDCLRVCDMDLDAENEYCNSAESTPDARRTCKLGANQNWKRCRASC